MLRRSIAAALFTGASAVSLVIGLAPSSSAAAAPQPASVVSQVPVSWTPNVSGTTNVDGGSGCNATYFGSGNLTCQSEVYGTAYENGEVVVVGAFTEACQPGTLAQGLCSPGTQVTRDDIFAYQASTGLIDPNFAPQLDAGPAWDVVAGPAGSNTVYVGGQFTTVNGATHKGVVELNVNPGVTTGATADGSVVSAFKAQVSNQVTNLALSPDGTALYLGGQFTSADSATTFANGTTVSGLARVNATTGSLDTSFGFTLSDPISGLAVKIEAMALTPDGTELAFSGTPLQVDGQARPRLAIVSTGTTLGGSSALTDFTAPILSNACSAEHDYVRALAFASDGSFLIIADTGYQSDGSTPYAACDAVARLNVNSTDTTTTGTAVDVAPAWINFAGGDSFYSVVVSGGVVYVGGHNRWVNNQCGNNTACEPNALMVNGIAALDANTGLGLPWWHPQTTRGFGTMYLNTFTAGTYDGTHPGLVLGTDVDVVGGAYHGENAVFPMAPTTSATPGGPIPSGLFDEEGGSNTGTPMCMDDAGNSLTSGSPVDLATCLNDAEQNWTVAAGGQLQVNGLCLDTAGGATAGTPEVVLDTCQSGDATQSWTQGAGQSLVNAGASAAQGTQVCLADPGSSTTSGTQLSLAPCDGGSEQAWPLPAAQGPPAPPATGPVWSEEEQQSTQIPCLDDLGDSTATGNPVQMYQCRGDTEQQWTATAAGTIQLSGTSDCLDTASGGTTQATQVVVDPCNGTSSQVWTPGANYSLVQQASGLCLDDPGFATANGQTLQIWVCNGGSNQGWRLPTV